MILIDDFPNYLVSSEGLVYSKISKRFISQRVNDRGYLICELWKNNTRKACKIHRLVAQAFCEKNIFNEVNHIDGNKLNNHFLNLEWCSRSHNLKEAYRLGLRKPINKK